MKAAAALVTLVLVAVLLGATDGAAAPKQAPALFGEVGPEFEISLRDAQGSKVTHLDPGTYTVHVEDKSDFHTFHLEGPGVDERTEVAFTGTVEWTVTFRDGTYMYHCDPHRASPGPSRSATRRRRARRPRPAPSPRRPGSCSPPARRG